MAFLGDYLLLSKVFTLTYLLTQAHHEVKVATDNLGSPPAFPDR